MDILKISLAAARVNANMTQTEVAQKLQISKETLINWEKGRSSPTFAKASELADLYNIPIQHIFLSIKST